MMPPNSQKQHLPVDVLSNLPENVLTQILMLFPLRDVVRTSVLSKKWRYNWCRLPQLILDQNLWETTKDLISPNIKFVDIINHFLIHHVGPISKCILSIPDLGDCPNMEAVICFLSTNSIQDLVLLFPVGSEYELPSSLYACLQLRCLTLQRCSLRLPPPVFQGFDRLVSLVLSRVTISSEFLGSLISHCRLLEHLVLEELDNSNHIEVTAPKLQSFVFKGNMHFIHLKNVPLLAKVSHESVESSVKAGKHDLTNFFESIPALEHLDWNYINFRYMVTGPAEIPTRLPSALNSLKRLYLTEVLLDELVELSCVLCLLRSSPYLEELEIKEPVDLSGELLAGVDEIPAIFSDMTFNHLREVKINGVAGEWTKLELIKVLLAKSPVLTKMVIDIVVEGDQFIKVKEKITQFQRASPKAEIVITMYVHG